MVAYFERRFRANGSANDGENPENLCPAARGVLDLFCRQRDCLRCALGGLPVKREHHNARKQQEHDDCSHNEDVNLRGAFLEIHGGARIIFIKAHELRIEGWRGDEPRSGYARSPILKARSFTAQKGQLCSNGRTF